MKTLKKLLVMLLCVLMVVLSAVGCKRKPLDENYEDDGEYYKAKVVMPFNAANVPEDLDLIVAEVNKITKEKINCEIELVPYILSEYVNKTNLLVSSGEPFDLMYSSTANYYLNIEMGGYYPIEELLKKYAPKTYAQFKPQLLDQMRHTDGKIYGITNVQILPRTASFWARDNDLFTAFMAENGYDENSFKNLTLSGKFDVMENYALYLKREGKGKGKDKIGRTHAIDLANFMDSFAGFDKLCQGAGVPGVVRVTDDLSDGKIEVIDQFRSPEMTEYLNRLQRWNELEIIPEDPTDIGGGGSAALDFQIGSTWKPYDKIVYKQFGVEKEMTNYAFSDPYYYQDSMIATMWSVSSTSENPARAVKLIELLHTDAQINNLFKIGIEGMHYELVNDGKQAKSISSTYYNDDTRWAIGNELLTYPLDTQEADVWEKTQKINDEAVIPSVIGFVFDREPVLTEIQLCQAVYQKYAARLEAGRERAQLEPQLYEMFLEEMDNAGSATIIAEKQKQLNSYLKDKGLI